MTAFDLPWALLMLPLALLPWWRSAEGRTSNAWVAWAPPDTASRVLEWGLRGTASLAIAAIVVAIAGPYWPERAVERMGRGAEIVLVLDRSRSMDQGFVGSAAGAPRGTGPEAIEYYMRRSPGRDRDSKGKVARQLLSEFAASRRDDRLALTVFSTLPIPVVGFTQRDEIIQAAIAAGNIGRGLSETNIGFALESALLSFEGRPYTGSRLIMLVSDGGDRIEPDMRERIVQLVRRERVAINWLYLRSANSPSLTRQPDDSETLADSVPELFLNRFFESLPTPYRAYEAGDPETLKRAIDDVSRLENLPIRYVDTEPRVELAAWCHAVALVCALLLLAARVMTTRSWAWR